MPGELRWSACAASDTPESVAGAGAERSISVVKMTQLTLSDTTGYDRTRKDDSLKLSYAIVNPTLVSQSSILAHPAHIRWAWLALIIEGQFRDGVIPGLTPFQLSCMAHCSVSEAQEALDVFLSPDPFSACHDEEGRRLVPTGNPNEYRMVSYEGQQELIAKAREAARKRADRYGQNRTGRTTSGSIPPVLPPPPSPPPSPPEKKRTPAVSEKKSAKDLVEGFTLEQKHREWGGQNCPDVPLDTELEAWKDRMREAEYRWGKPPGRPIADAQASFYKACRNAQNWGTYTKGKGWLPVARKTDDKTPTVLAIDPNTAETPLVAKVRAAMPRVIAWIAENGDPDSDPAISEAFSEWAPFVEDWDCWKAACQSAGVDPKGRPYGEFPPKE